MKKLYIYIHIQINIYIYEWRTIYIIIYIYISKTYQKSLCFLYLLVSPTAFIDSSRSLSFSRSDAANSSTCRSVPKESKPPGPKPPINHWILHSQKYMDNDILPKIVLRRYSMTFYMKQSMQLHNTMLENAIIVYQHICNNTQSISHTQTQSDTWW